MKRRWLGLWASLAACAAATKEQVPVASPPPPAPVVVKEEPSYSEVSVRGIEGSMSSYDVRTTMEERSAELSACQTQRVRVVPVLAGAVEYAIQVDREGKVGEVVVNASDLGDGALERCVGEVIMQTQFPPPNGGDARITWTMMLEPARPGGAPEVWAHEDVEKVVDKHLSELQEECGFAERAKEFDVTAYVNRRGRIVSAGVLAKSAAPVEDLDCIVAELRTWPMPKPKRSRFAKVSFKLPSEAPPREQRRHGRAQEGNARSRRSRER